MSESHAPAALAAAAVAAVAVEATMPAAMAAVATGLLGPLAICSLGWFQALKSLCLRGCRGWRSGAVGSIIPR